MVHLPALPGHPGNRLSLDAIIEHAVTDALTLKTAGFKAVMVENFGDAPFSPGALEPVTVAAMGIVVREVVRLGGLIVGVNCLRNDAIAALGIAAATGAALVRVNVHTGVAATDQGLIAGHAYESLRTRQRLCPEVRILADVHVKHSTPINQPDIALAAEETAHRGMADGIIVSGPSTGRPAELDEISRVKQAVPDRVVLAGSGAMADTIRAILERADGAIVGSSLKPGGDLSRPIDARLAGAFITAAGG